MTSRAKVAYAAALMLTAAVLGARLVPVPALSDPTGAAVPHGLGLAVPPGYLILAPLFTVWDGVALLSRTRMEGFLLGLGAGYLCWRLLRRWYRRRPLRSIAWREALLVVIAICALAGFVLGGALWHRPMVALTGVPDSLMVVDFHTHTAQSRDVRGTLVSWYDLEANRRWHDRAGYDAAFVTDHNNRTLDAPSFGAPGAPVLCPGSEIGAWRSHVVLLGPTAPDDREPYEKDMDGLLKLLAESRAQGSPAILSIPEYERNHRDRIDDLLAAGAAGIEISNGSPKASELSGARRDTVISIARDSDAAVVGVSDHHGWGATAATWSLVPRPAEADADLCAAAVKTIAAGGFAGTRIAERHRVSPDAWWPALLTPVAVLWESWRSMGWPLTLAWLAWIWAAALVTATARTASRPSDREPATTPEPVRPAA